MQKLLKKFLLTRLGNTTLIGMKFYFFQPLQKIQLSPNQNLTLLPKLCVNHVYQNKLLKKFKHIKYPLFVKNVNSFEKLFLALKRNDAVFVRCVNFYSSQNSKNISTFFETNLNLSLFFKSTMMIIFFLVQLKKIRNSFFLFPLL